MSSIASVTREETNQRPVDGGDAAKKPPRRFSQQSIHLLRNQQTQTLALSRMADQKASILMGATFVVFTISVGQASNGVLPASLAVLAIFAFASAICAVLAVVPNFSGRAPRSDDIHRNRLFFGVFAHQPEDEWIDEMLDEMGSDEAIYRMMLRDIHQNGMVLHRRKYRFLGYAYRLFVSGLCATMLTLILEYVLSAAG